ncbi:MAG: RluA family pseudouridine synthase [Pyrinomonadaceae bacterium]
MTENFCFEVTQIEKRMRLDEFLFDKIRAVSRMHLRNLIAREKCLLNEKRATAGERLKVGDKIEIEVDLKAETSMLPENIPLEIIYEDAEILVVNKPAGMLVHPTKGVKKGTLLNALSYHLNCKNTNSLDQTKMTQESEFKIQNSEITNDELRVPNPESQILDPKFIRAGLIHRLDKQTSGLMVVSKTARAHRIISKQIQNRQVEKKYFALVEGIIAEDSGAIVAPIYHNEQERIWQISDKGKPSESGFRVLERRADTTLLELEPVTGRTNQLRLHLTHIGHPIIGDTIYGGRAFSRLCLHAYRLCFRHPNGNQRLEFETKLPNDFLS